MIKRINLSGSTNPQSNDTYSPCVMAGDFIFTSHQGGNQDSNDAAVQLEGSLLSLERTLEAAGVTLDDVVQLNLLLKNADDFRGTKPVFERFFKSGYPARTTYITDFVAPHILVQVDAIAYKKATD